MKNKPKQRFNFKAVYLNNFRMGLATNSSSTHSLIYRNKGELFNDLDVLELNFYGRCDSTIAASRKAKIKYILANIYRNDILVRELSLVYPEMKEYYPLIKKQMKSNSDNDYSYDETFGMYYRGALDSDDLEFDIKYLKHIIDDDRIVIVGGSDETEFVYDTIEGHEFVPMADDIYNWEYPYDKNRLIKNGNYYVSFGKFSTGTIDWDCEDRERYKYASGGRIRFTMDDNPPVPEYPELVDLKITNKCENGCKFCFMDSTVKGKHADLYTLYSISNNLPRGTEFSIGGGNVLLYPHLGDLLEHMENHGHIINITVNVNDVKTLMEPKMVRDVLSKVDGIGVSVFSVSDLEEIKKLNKFIKDNKNIKSRKFVVAHVIPEMIGAENTRDIIQRCNDICGADQMSTPVLLLGYKENGRGKDCEHKKMFTDAELDAMLSDSHCISVDTTFANKYRKYIESHFATDQCITYNEGEFSMYIDGVENKAYKSSYHTDVPHNFDSYSISETFQDIREECGFERYKPSNYWDDAADLPDDEDDE